MFSFTGLCGHTLKYIPNILFVCIVIFAPIGHSLVAPTLFTAVSTGVKHSKKSITSFQNRLEVATRKPYKDDEFIRVEKFADRITSLFQSSTSENGIPTNSNEIEKRVTTLMKIIQKKNEESNEEINSKYDDDMKELIQDIEEKFAKIKSKDDDKNNNNNNNNNNDESLSRFQKLIGLYTVDQVLTKRKNDNPVGGKWTRKNSVTKNLFRSRRTFQHILATTDKKCHQNSTVSSSSSSSSSSSDSIVVAEAINVISFDALFGLFRITVMLRGDAIPLTRNERDELKLTNYAVRANFDAPRIVFGKRGRLFNINLGPRSSVVLDTTYIDDVIRIGKGGTSGSRFVFKRCDDTTEEEEDSSDILAEANEYKALLERRPMRRSKMVGILLGVLGCGAYNLKLGRTLMGSVLLLVSGMGGAALKFSTGGIEDDQQMKPAEN